MAPHFIFSILHQSLQVFFFFLVGFLHDDSLPEEEDLEDEEPDLLLSDLLLSDLLLSELSFLLLSPDDEDLDADNKDPEPLFCDEAVRDEEPLEEPEEDEEDDLEEPLSLTDDDLDAEALLDDPLDSSMGRASASVGGSMTSIS